MLQVLSFCSSVPDRAAKEANEWFREETTRSRRIISVTATESASLDSLGRRRPSYTVWVVYEE